MLVQGCPQSADTWSGATLLTEENNERIKLETTTLFSALSRWLMPLGTYTFGHECKAHTSLFGVFFFFSFCFLFAPPFSFPFPFSCLFSNPFFSTSFFHLFFIKLFFTILGV